MKIFSIVGARPEFIQSASVSQALRSKHHELLVHTGQHYDYLMSQTFFDELGLAAPDFNLEVGSSSHGQQTAEVMMRLETLLLEEKPDLVIVRGDTNSTLGGALAASKLCIPIAHIEAGERSFDRRMPEEINRLVADHIAGLHFCASQNAVCNLAAEGISKSVHWVGDVMYDAMLRYRPLARQKSKIMQQLGLEPGGYCLVTVHRQANTDDPARLEKIVSILNQAQEPVVFPLHPRTRNKIAALGASFAAHVQAIEPLGYFDMVALEESARLIATDSGGVQREAYFLSVPCLTLRDETEWVDTVRVGWNQLVGVEPEAVLGAWRSFRPPAEHPPIFGDGRAGEKIAEIIDNEGMR